MANGGEFATSMRNRCIGSVSDGRETSRGVYGRRSLRCASVAKQTTSATRGSSSQKHVYPGTGLDPPVCEVGGCLCEILRGCPLIGRLLLRGLVAFGGL